MIKEFTRMSFICKYQRSLTKKRHRVLNTPRKKSWVHWNIIQEYWHTGNSQILLSLLLVIEPNQILSKSHSFKSVIHLIHLLQLPPFSLGTLPYLTHTLHKSMHIKIYRFKSHIPLLSCFSTVSSNSLYCKRASIYHFKNYKMNWVIFLSCYKSLVIVRAHGNFWNLVN